MISDPILMILLLSEIETRFTIRGYALKSNLRDRFLAPLPPVINTLLPFSSENEDKVFNHGVLTSKEKSPSSPSHQGFKASKLFHQKSPMLIHGDNTPNLGDCPDSEASRARGFLSFDHKSFKSSASFGNPIS
ncbi:hypothetical protein Tco_1094915 [Tanacetum coccineum]